MEFLDFYEPRLVDRSNEPKKETEKQSLRELILVVDEYNIKVSQTSRALSVCIKKA